MSSGKMRYRRSAENQDFWLLDKGERSFVRSVGRDAVVKIERAASARTLAPVPAVVPRTQLCRELGEIKLGSWMRHLGWRRRCGERQTGPIIEPLQDQALAEDLIARLYEAPLNTGSTGKYGSLGRTGT
jgi:hypothetical protein